MKVKLETVRGTIYDFEANETIDEMLRQSDTASMDRFYRIIKPGKVIIIPMRDIESITYEE